MKKIYKKEEGVSPVIATILMVAITVVLAATVWLLVSGYMGGTAPTLQGTLQYDYQASDLASHNATFTLLLSQPTNGLNPNDVNLHVNGTAVKYIHNGGTGGNTGSAWGFIDNDGNGKLSNGDTIWIHDSHIWHGATISFGATGYSGSITVTIP